MIPRSCIVLLWFACLTPAQTPKCVEVEGDRILARDFAVSLPGFGRLSPETALAPAPMPGVRRFFHPSELAALARRYSVDIDQDAALCFERQTEMLDRDRVLEAMRLALPLPGLEIEIVETSLYPVPRGRLEFRRESLGTPASPSAHTAVEWRGNVVYGDNQRFGIWARVLISAPMPRVVAAEALRKGEAIAASQVRVETADRFPIAGDVAQTVDQVAGRAPMRAVAPGAEIHLAQLMVPPDVNRGELVEVEVRSGAAHLALTGKAESAGRSGDTIVIRNLSSNKVFQARVEGKGKASLDAGRDLGN
ncbi:MAG: flagellar basal body P-ring formation chaperone FlgA [Bryobacteraceae bacterium]